MTTSGPGPTSAAPPPRVPTPLLKAPATASTSSESATGATAAAGVRSRDMSRTRTRTRTTAAPARSLTPQPQQQQGGGGKAAFPTPAALSTTTAINSSSGGGTAVGQQSQSQQQAPLARRPPAAPTTAATSPSSSDPLSDKVTAHLIRRTLLPQQQQQDKKAAPPPIEELLPPLTSRNDVDLQLYAIIAIVIREFVQNWYARVTPQDGDFVAEVVLLIAHCTRALEQRLRRVDLEALLFDELPGLLDRHVEAYRTAYRPIVAPPLEVDPREVYHSLWPLPALSPVVPRRDDPTALSTGEGRDRLEGEQAANEAAYRQLLVQSVLAVLLPTEDLENGCLTALVGQILSELIVGGVVARKAAEPWMVLEGLGILARKLGGGAGGAAAASSGNSTKSEKRKERQRRGGEGFDSPPSPAKGKGGWGWGLGRAAFSPQRFFWSILQFGFVAFAVLRTLVVTLATYRSVPSRLAGGSSSTSSRVSGPLENKKGKRGEKGMQATIGSSNSSSRSPAKGPTGGGSGTNSRDNRNRGDGKVPVLSFRIWAALSNLIEMDVRMPWLGGGLSLARWMATDGPGRLAGLDGPVDRLISQALAHHVLDPRQLPPLLRTLRGVLFPNNAMGKSSLIAPSDEQEFLALRRRCAKSIWALVPKGVGRLYFGASMRGRGRSCNNSNSNGDRRRSSSKKMRSRRRRTTETDAGGSVGSGQQPQHSTARRTASASASASTSTSWSPPRTGPNSGDDQMDTFGVSTSGPRAGARAGVGTGAVTAAARLDLGHHDVKDGDNSAGVEEEEDLDDGDAASTEEEDEDEDDDEERIISEIESGILDVFSDAYCNKHLMYSALELILVRLIPELADRGVIELLAERLS